MHSATARGSGDSDAESSGGSCSCSGSPSSCSSVDPPNCSDVQGCSMELGANVLDSSEDYCDGSPAPCEHFDNAKACGEQPGCHWQ